MRSTARFRLAAKSLVIGLGIIGSTLSQAACSQDTIVRHSATTASADDTTFRLVGWGGRNFADPGLTVEFELTKSYEEVQEGQLVRAEVRRDVYLRDQLIIPRGSVAILKIVSGLKKTDKGSGQDRLFMMLDKVIVREKEQTLDGGVVAPVDGNHQRVKVRSSYVTYTTVWVGKTPVMTPTTHPALYATKGSGPHAGRYKVGLGKGFKLSSRQNREVGQAR